MDHAELNLRWAATMVAALADGGVRHAVISPGSRSTPLVLACDREPRIETRVLPDERSAAFFALGLARASRTPAAVIATSGTAPANWYPAVIEASQDAVPLLLLSADRPPALHGCGANQAVDQLRLFGSHVRAFVQLPEPVAGAQALGRLHGRIANALDQARWPRPGPVHLNVPFDEPLVPTVLPPPPAPAPAVGWRPGPLSPADAAVRSLAARLDAGPGVIVCGRGAFAADAVGGITRLAARLGCPILADPLSGLRFGAHDRSRVLTAYDAFLRQPGFVADHRPAWVLRLGAAPVSKVLLAWIDQFGGDNLLVAPSGPWPDPGRSATAVLHADTALLAAALAEAVAGAAPDAWFADFAAADARARALIDAAGDPSEDVAALNAIARDCPDGATLFCGNSLVVRQVDSLLHGGPQCLRLVGNRGASGIDGNVSTTLGLAAAAPGPVIGLLGDVALYHDMNGLLAARGLDATLVVFNNGGGAIFDHLPQRGLAAFERYWLTPTGLDIARIAALYELRHARVRTGTAFSATLREALDRPGVDLIEVVVGREASRAWHERYRALVATRA